MKFVIRVDADLEMGTGHLMRCLALGLGCGCEDVVFITSCKSERLLERINKEGFKVYTVPGPSDMEQTKSILEKENPSWVVLDGYHFDGRYQKAVKDLGCKLLVIDDFAHLDHYYADIILNQNYGADKFSYECESHTRLLLGTRYVLLRREFMKYADYKRDIPEVARKLLITMGGADPDNNTLKVLKAVNLVERPLEVKVVVGAGNPHFESVKEEARKGRHRIELLRNVENMAMIMAWADAALSAGGTTVWELAFMGLPSLLCIVAHNQEDAVNSLSGDNIFQSLGWIKDRGTDEISRILQDLIRNKEVRSEMSGKGGEIVDGMGVKRVVGEAVRYRQAVYGKTK